MKKFQFKLEKFFELKAYREREAEIALGHAIGELSLIENEIKSIAGKRLEASALRFKAGSSADEIRYADLYILRLDRTADRLMEDAAKAELKVSEARDAYLEASKEKKILEKLKEKKEKEYKKFVLLEEDKAIDEINNQRRRSN